MAWYNNQFVAWITCSLSYTMFLGDNGRKKRKIDTFFIKKVKEQRGVPTYGTVLFYFCIEIYNKTIGV